jgi:hypothetical protein
MLKILTKVIAARLNTICSDLGLVIPEQVGFMRQEECATQVATLLECCQRRRLRGLDTVLGFLDLKKAYDMVPHDRLFNKLAAAGIGPTCIRFLRAMYENTFIRVRLGNQVGDPVPYKRGVRQGCPTSPLLFNLYINDILEGMTGCPVEGLQEGLKGLLFADDTVVVASSREELRDKMMLIELWMSTNGMGLNPSKCGVMEISHQYPSPCPTPINYVGETLPEVDKYVYLGVEFNRYLNVSEMARYRLEKGRATLECLRRTLSSNKVALEYKRMLIANVLTPRLTYGLELYGMANSRASKLKVVLDNALKCIVKRRNFCRLRLYEELDLKSIDVASAVGRARGVAKWGNSRGPMRELIMRRKEFKSKKRTWINQSFTWLKRMKIDPSLPQRELVAEVLKTKTEAHRTRDRSLVGSQARALGLWSGKLLRRLQVNTCINDLGVVSLLRMRTGTFSFTRTLKRDLSICAPDKCLFCNGVTDEDVWHLLVECELYSGIRKRLNGYTDLLPRSRASETVKIETLTSLLGGETGAGNSQQCGARMGQTVLFLSHAIPLRSTRLTARLTQPRGG